MSAPRKIWVSPRELLTMAKPADQWANPKAAVAYHHDDVVQELVAAAQRLVGHEQWGTCKYTDEGMWADGEALRAALAKIAQEG